MKRNLDHIISKVRQWALGVAMVSSVLNPAELTAWAEKYALDEAEKEKVEAAAQNEFDKQKEDQKTAYFNEHRDAQKIKEAGTFENTFKDWFKRYHLSKMSADQRARWEDLRGNRSEIAPNKNKIFIDDKRTAVQKGWGDLTTGELLDTVPDLTLALDDPGWNEFYRIVQTALRAMDDDRKELSRADPENGTVALDKYFGEGKPFSKPVLDSKNTNDADILKTVDNIRKELANKSIIYDYLENLPDYTKIFTKEYPITQFVKELNAPGWMGNPKCREHLRSVAVRLQEQVEMAVPGIDADSTKEKQTRINIIKGLGDLVKLSARMNPENDEIDPANMQLFKQPEFYKELLKDLYNKDDKESKSAFFRNFEKYAPGNRLTGFMNYALEKNNYATGDNQLVPKFEEGRDWFQDKQKKWDDWREQHIEKLWKKQHSHIYSAPLAKGIIDAIYKAKPAISPTDGILKILEKKDELRPKIQAKSSGSLKGFDFLTDSLKEMKDSGEFDKALDGALRNGYQCQALAMEIIKRGVKNREIEKAKVALEVLAVMRYDTFSSAHYNEVFKEKFDPLKNTSFMKGDLKHIFGAATTVVNLMMKGGYKAAVAVRNTYQGRRGKINLNDKRLANGRADARRDSRDRQGFNYWSETKERLDKANADLLVAEDAARQVKGLDAAEDAITESEARLSRYTQWEKLKQEVETIKTKLKEAEEKSASKKMKEQARFEEFKKLDEKENRTEAEEQRLKEIQAEEVASQAEEADSKDEIASLKQEIATKEEEVRKYNDIKTPEDAKALEDFRDREEEKFNNEQRRLEGLGISEKRQYELRRNLFLAKNEQGYAEAAHTIKTTKKEKDEAKGVPGKPARPEADELAKFEELVYFWNYVNGFSGAKVNDFNITRSSKTFRESANPTNGFDNSWMASSGFMATHDYDRE